MNITKILIKIRPLSTDGAIYLILVSFYIALSRDVKIFSSRRLRDTD